jgi:hypothetical protein
MGSVTARVGLSRSRKGACVLAILASSAIGSAQDIDSLPEGTTATVLTLPGGVTLQDLDTGLGTAPDAFFVDDASGSLLQYDVGNFPGNHVVTFGGFTPGPDNLYGRCKSFRILISPPTPAAYFQMWFSRADLGNTVHLDYLSGGVVQYGSTVPIAPGTAPFHVHFNPTVFPANLDEIVVTGSGPWNGGAFHAVIDGFWLGGIVDFAPTCDGAQGALVSCPCGNNTTPLDSEGCAHALGYGARLRLTGEPHISNDTLKLVCMQLPPNAPALFYQATQTQSGGAGVLFGDGKRCGNGIVSRLATKASATGIAVYPDVGDAPIHVQGQVSGSTTRTYQVWYRSAQPFCTPYTFNLSNGFSLGWSP